MAESKVSLRLQTNLKRFTREWIGYGTYNFLSSSLVKYQVKWQNLLSLYFFTYSWTVSNLKISFGSKLKVYRLSILKTSITLRPHLCWKGVVRERLTVLSGVMI